MNAAAIMGAVMTATSPFVFIWIISRIKKKESPSGNVHDNARIRSELSETDIWQAQGFPGRLAKEPKIAQERAMNVVYGVAVGESISRMSFPEKGKLWSTGSLYDTEGRMLPATMGVYAMLTTLNGKKKMLAPGGYIEAYTGTVCGYPSIESGHPIPSGGIYAAIRGMAGAAVAALSANPPKLAARQASRMAAAGGFDRNTEEVAAVLAGCTWLAATSVPKDWIVEYASEFLDMNGDENSVLRDDPTDIRKMAAYGIRLFMVQGKMEDAAAEAAIEGGEAYMGAAAIAAGLSAVYYGVPGETQAWADKFIPKLDLTQKGKAS